MHQKINFPSRKESAKLHKSIIQEYEDMLEITEGKKIQMILGKLAEKYGYSCAQAVRNMMRNYKNNNAEKELA